MYLRDLEEQKTVEHRALSYLLLESKVLDGEMIVLAFQKKLLKELRAKYPGIVIYFPPEIEELYQHRDNPEFIRKAHLVKKNFRAWVIPGANNNQKENEK